MSVEEMTAQVTAVLEEIRPHLQADGGDVELVEVTEDGIVKVTLTGACSGCPMARWRRSPSRTASRSASRKKSPASSASSL